MHPSNINVMCGNVDSKIVQRREDRLKYFTEEFPYTNEYLQRLTAKVERHLVRSYERRGCEHDINVANFMSLDCCLHKLTEGTETGTYYGVDVGGTNMRVVRCELQGKGHCDVQVTNYNHEEFGIDVSDETTPVSKFFDYIATNLRDMMTEYEDGTPEEPLSVGLCFSFGIEMTEIDHAIVLAAGKNFHIGNSTDEPLVGCDAVKCLNEALARVGAHAQITGCLNDTTGTMMSASYESGKYDEIHAVKMGMIVGTGFNCCVTHELAAEKGYNGNTVNLEAGFLQCRDHEVDTLLNFATAYKMPLLAERRISGKWLGELVRTALVWIMNGEAPDKMYEENSLSGEETARIFNTENEREIVLIVTEVMEQSFHWAIPHESYINLVKQVVDAVWTRSAQVVAAIITGVAAHIDGPFSIGVDGSVYCKNPTYQESVRENLKKLLGDDNHNNVHLIKAHDGSGKGAAMLACAYASTVRRVIDDQAAASASQKTARGVESAFAPKKSRSTMCC